MTGDPIRFSGLTESLWANRAGRKADIASGLGWLLGFAWLDQDAPFSDYAGHDRTIMLLEGAGFTLTPPDGVPRRVTRPMVPMGFDGAGPIDCRLTAGPCVVLNALTARADARHAVAVVGAEALDAASVDAAFCVVLQGAIETGTAIAHPRDTIPLPASGVLRGSADLRAAIVRFTGPGL
jgi:hypothetical protein